LLIRLYATSRCPNCGKIAQNVGPSTIVDDLIVVRALGHDAVALVALDPHALDHDTMTRREDAVVQLPSPSRTGPLAFLHLALQMDIVLVDEDRLAIRARHHADRIAGLRPQDGRLDRFALLDRERLRCSRPASAQLTSAHAASTALSNLVIVDPSVRLAGDRIDAAMHVGSRRCTREQFRVRREQRIAFRRSLVSRSAAGIRCARSRAFLSSSAVSCRSSGDGSTSSSPVNVLVAPAASPLPGAL
jgi:hypothetical protein